MEIHKFYHLIKFSIFLHYKKQVMTLLLFFIYLKLNIYKQLKINFINKFRNLLNDISSLKKFETTYVR